jgi:hypothetical protein
LLGNQPATLLPVFTALFEIEGCDAKPHAARPLLTSPSMQEVPRMRTR